MKAALSDLENSVCQVIKHRVEGPHIEGTMSTFHVGARLCADHAVVLNLTD